MLELGSFSAGTLLGMVLGAFLNHSLASRRNSTERNRNNFDTAAKPFRESLDCIIQAFNNETDIDSAVLTNYSNQSKQFREFKQHLTGGKLTAAEKTWAEYESYYNDEVEGNNKIPEDKRAQHVKNITVKLRQMTK